MSDLARAREVVAGVLGCPVGDIGADAVVGSLPEWDSMAHVSIILAAEERLGRMLTSEEIASFVSVASLADILARGAAANPARLA